MGTKFWWDMNYVRQGEHLAGQWSASVSKERENPNKGS
jgi:hypothetical protein